MALNYGIYGSRHRNQGGSTDRNDWLRHYGIFNPKTWIPPILASAITGPIATCIFHLEMNGPAVSSGMGTCGLVGQIGVYTGWLASGKAITAFDWIGLVMICFILPAVLSVFFCNILRKKQWIKENDLKLN